MNRRSFLRFLCVAPVAAPVAIIAAKEAPAYASGGVYTLPREWYGGVIGETVSEASIPLRALRPRLGFTNNEFNALRRELAQIKADAVNSLKWVPSDDCFTNADLLTGEKGES